MTKTESIKQTVKTTEELRLKIRTIKASLTTMKTTLRQVTRDEYISKVQALAHSHRMLEPDHGIKGREREALERQIATDTAELNALMEWLMKDAHRDPSVMSAMCLQLTQQAVDWYDC